TSRHTSPEDGELADSRKAPSSSSDLKAPCLHLSQIGTSIIKKLKERAFSLPGKLPAPSILLIFALRLGAGVRSRFINACYFGDFRISDLRVYRQTCWSLTPSRLTSRRMNTWRRSAAISSFALYVS